MDIYIYLNHSVVYQKLTHYELKKKTSIFFKKGDLSGYFHLEFFSYRISRT